MSSKNTMAQEIYSGTASFGVIMSDLKAVFGVIIGIILISVGIYLIVKKVKRTSTVNATIANVNCVQTKQSNNDVEYSCKFDATYIIDGQTITKNLSSLPINEELVEGSTITLYYDPNNQTDISTDSGNFHIIGWLCIAFGLLISISGVVWAYLANKYKPVAAVSGAITGIEMLKNIF
jgi:hypothetical protein